MLIIISFFLFSSIVSAEDKQVEIFDIQQKKVIKTVNWSEEIQKESNRSLQSISNLYIKVNPLPVKGLLAKVPLQPPIKISNEWITTLADEIVFVFSEKDFYVIVYDDENQPYFFTLSKDPKPLLQLLLNQ